ncbi:MAG: hypothetical protein WBK91_05685 [Alphaproteobacteria bacterium]
MSDLATIYRYTDFTHAHYRVLLGHAAARYRFCSFHDFARDEVFVLWRHDVDYAPHAALALARIEASCGVQATYFLQLSSPFYNLFEPEIKACVKALADLGHDLGLHFDAAMHQVETAAQLQDALHRDRRILEDYCGMPVKSFSFHNPTPELLTYDSFDYAGMINAYAGYFRTEVTYCSDSNGIWRHRSLTDVLAEAPPALQVLTHPAWWTETPMAPRRKIFNCIMGRARHVLADYNRLLQAGGRVNVMELAAEFETLDVILGDAALPVQMDWLQGDSAAAAWRLARICVDRLGAGDPRLARYLPLLGEAMAAEDVRFLITLLLENKT